MAATTSKPLYLITDGGRLRNTGTLVRAVRDALEGADGAVGFVQLREQNELAAREAGISAASDSELCELAAELLPYCLKHDAQLIINRRVDLALRTGAHGVHLGSPVESVDETRGRYKDQLVLGYSAHSISEIEAVTRGGIDYLLFSPVFPPLSKNFPGKTLGLEQLRSGALRTPKLLFALGGIQASNAVECLEAGASGVAMMSSILLAPEPRVRAKEMAELTRRHRAD
ncbi:MAG: thiamine phosphate synthase [Bdellovibrionota bacterium]